MGKDVYAVGRSFLSEKCDSKLESDQKSRLNVRKSRFSPAQRWFFFQTIHGLHNSIPKHITTFNEKYAFRCLELIHNAALRVAARNFASNTTTSTKVGNKSSDRIARLAVECPLDSSHEWSIGTVTYSQSMINILNSPLLRQFELKNSGTSSRRENALDLPKDVTVLDHRSLSVPAHERVASTMSTNSTCSDESSSSSTAMYQGMLQCTWKGGRLHHVFSVDDKEVFVARASRVKSLIDKDLDCVYTFYASKSSAIEFNSFAPDLERVGMMQVSKSVTLCSDSSRIVETRFVLSTCSDCALEDRHTFDHNPKNGNRLNRKVANFFRTSRSFKLGTSSKSEEAGLKNAYSSPFEDVQSCVIDALREEDRCTPNLELAAIVIKEHVLGNIKKAGFGGWGMKFLKKPGNDATFTQNSAKRSKGIDVLFPAGFHGGPKRRNCGPSSLIERWTSGGLCDCGGWDIGCPLTILSTKSTVIGDSEEFKSIDLFIQDSRQEAPPIVKMVNISKGLYCISFQPTLSVLQCYAIAAAIVHDRAFSYVEK